MANEDIFNSNLSERLVDIIKERILNNEFKPGERINVKELSQEFHTSTTPIRDALNKVASQGMVMINPRVGYFVKTFDKKEVDDIFFMRIKLELAILESVFDSITSKELSRWKEINTTYANKNLSKEEMHRFNTKDSIHLLLCNKCSNTYLKDVYITFFEKVLLISSVIAHDYYHYSDHSDILEAIESGSMEHAKDVLIQHLEDARKSIHEHLANQKI